jgi:hypothetical protein
LHTFVFAFAAILMTGCQTVPTELPTPYLEPKANFVPREHEALPVLVKLTFPAAIDPQIYGEMSRIYTKGHFPMYEAPARTPGGAQFDETAFARSLAKTSFFAYEFYMELQKRLPPGSILVEPVTITVNDQGRYVYRESENAIPAALTVDFYAYDYAAKLADGISFGRYLTPMIAIKSSARTRFEGFVAGTQYLPPHEPTGSAHTALRDLENSNIIRAIPIKWG